MSRLLRNDEVGYARIRVGYSVENADYLINYN